MRFQLVFVLAVAIFAVDVSAKNCSADNQVNLWELLHSTPTSVVSYLQLILATTMNKLNSITAINTIFLNCGGKCLSESILGMANTMTAADTGLRNCAVKNKTCIDNASRTANQSIDVLAESVRKCLKGVTINPTNAKWSLYVQSIKGAVLYAIKEDAKALSRPVTAPKPKPKPKPRPRGRRPVITIKPRPRPSNAVKPRPRPATAGTRPTTGVRPAPRPSTAVKPRPSTAVKPRPSTAGIVPIAPRATIGRASNVRPVPAATQFPPG